MTTVEELIEKLKQYPKNTKVYLAHEVADDDGGHIEYEDNISVNYRKFDNVWPQDINIDGLIIE